MSDELSHVAQWEELRARARRFGMQADYGAKGFCLYHGDKIVAENLPTLADLRAAISDTVAARRAAGEAI